LNADLDKNGYISYSEFITAAMNKEIALVEDNLKESFSFLDLD
jgi:Ca2+-binding EF-hand superfamily protein